MAFIRRPSVLRITRRTVQSVNGGRTGLPCARNLYRRRSLGGWFRQQVKDAWQ